MNSKVTGAPALCPECGNELDVQRNVVVDEPYFPTHPTCGNRPGDGRGCNDPDGCGFGAQDNDEHAIAVAENEGMSAW